MIISNRLYTAKNRPDEVHEQLRLKKKEGLNYATKNPCNGGRRFPGVSYHHHNIANSSENKVGITEYKRKKAEKNNGTLI